MWRESLAGSTQVLSENNHFMVQICHRIDYHYLLTVRYVDASLVGRRRCIPPRSCFAISSRNLPYSRILTLYNVCTDEFTYYTEYLMALKWEESIWRDMGLVMRYTKTVACNLRGISWNIYKFLPINPINVAAMWNLFSSVALCMHFWRLVSMETILSAILESKNANSLVTKWMVKTTRCHVT